MKKIAVTGGSGYIGAHTIVSLLESGYEVISIDDHSRSDDFLLKGVKEITGKTITNYPVDICNYEKTKAIFELHSDIEGIIHFAAYKSVPESVSNPLLYYHNNIESLVNILRICEEQKINNFIFSSSCSVYGNIKDLPVREETVLNTAESPYGRTKQIGEQIIKDFTLQNANINCVLLRYFNPAGAHQSCKIGEKPGENPNNLVPCITKFALGLLPVLNVYGDDYDTRDGSCIRDFVHVTDIAEAHTMALNYLFKGDVLNNYEIINLGTGSGISVLEAITAFEEVTRLKLNYKITKRREGDVASIYANNDKALQLLKWKAKYDIKQIMETAWNWEKYIKNNISPE